MDRYSEIVSQIKYQWRTLLSTRAVFPHMRGNMVGATKCSTAPLYRNRGYDISFNFAEPLTIERIREVNGIGYWINQNYVIRVYALLDSYGVISQTTSIDSQLSGHEEIDILRRLRNEFAHTSGWYDSSDPDKKRLRERIITHFSLRAENHPEEHRKFPIPIDKVLLPLTQGCEKYVEAWCEI